MRIASLNVSSLKRHLIEIELLLSNKNIDILVISESWLTPLFDSSAFSIAGYDLVRNDRGLISKKVRDNNDNFNERVYIQGGGVAFYIRSEMRYSIVMASNNVQINETEFLLISVECCGKLLIGGVYRRPKGNTLSKFFTRLQEISHLFDHTVLAGDLNSDLLSDNYYSKHLRNLVIENNMYLTPTGATHHCAESETWIDVMLVDSSDKVLSFEKSVAPYINGHDYIILDLYLARPDKPVYVTTSRDFRCFSPSAFLDDLLPQIQELDSVQSVNDRLDRFRLAACNLFDVHAPLSTRTFKRKPLPWFTSELRRMCKDRDKLHKRAKESGSPSLKESYRIMRRDVKKAIRKARDDFLINGCKEQSSAWKFLRKFDLIRSKSSSPLNFFTKDELMTYYSTTTCTHPPCSLITLNNVLSNRQITNTVQTKFQFRLLDRVEVQQMMLACRSKARSVSCDGLSLAYFQDMFRQIAPFFTELFNLSITSCTYPTLWKQSVIVPHNKKSAPDSPNDTRPVANIPHFAKVFDTLLVGQVVDYLERESLIVPQQSGFRSDYSTQTALLKITNDVRKGAEEGLVTVLLLFDYKQAFDKISHELLLIKLKCYGFANETIAWFHSYLSGRSQAVVGLDGTLSSFLPNTSGVPQGSSPGPIIFLIFINEIIAVLKNCKTTSMLFADDLQIYVQCRPRELDSYISLLNEDAQRVVDWSRDNGLHLNVAKTKAMVIGSHQHHMRLNLDTIAPVIVDGVVIPFTDVIKNLGVTFNKTLTWDTHVSQIYVRAHHALYRLRYRGYSLSSTVKMNLVNTLVVPFFDYACVVYNDLPDYLSVKLQRLCNSAVRFIFHLRKDAALQPYYERLGWLSLDHRRNYFMGSVLYKLFSTGRPAYLGGLFPKPGEEIRRSARNNNSSSFMIPTATTEMYRNSFSIRAMYFWDTLPVKIRLSTSLSMFKSRLYNYLLTLPQNYTIGTN